MATLYGGDVDGTPDGDFIYGTGELAILRGRAGDDTMQCSAGDDPLGGHDLTAGGSGSDLIYDSYGDDLIKGGPDADIIHDGSGDDVIKGGGGDDTLYAQDGHNTVLGNQGDDLLILNTGSLAGESMCDGGAGFDTILLFGSLTTALHYDFSRFERFEFESGFGDVRLLESQVLNEHGRNTMAFAMASHDGGHNLITINMEGDGINLTHFVVENWVSGDAIAVSGVDLSETMTGSAYDDAFFGGGGDDLLRGRDGDDQLTGGDGSDTLRGGAGDDNYDVTDAEDLIRESSSGGVDKIYASISYALPANIENLSLFTDATSGTGNRLGNVISAFADGDILDGGRGADTLNGGDGHDTFRFSAARSDADADHVSGFVSGVDRIALASSLFVGLASGALSSEAVRDGVEAQTDADRILYDDQTGALYFDADGTGSKHAAFHFATLDGAPALSGGDFVVV